MAENKGTIQRGFNVQCGDARLRGKYRDDKIITIEITHPNISSVVIEVTELENQQIIEGLMGLKYIKP